MLVGSTLISLRSCRIKRRRKQVEKVAMIQSRIGKIWAVATRSFQESFLFSAIFDALGFEY